MIIMANTRLQSYTSSSDPNFTDHPGRIPMTVRTPKTNMFAVPAHAKQDPDKVYLSFPLAVAASEHQTPPGR